VEPRPAHGFLPCSCSCCSHEHGYSPSAPVPPELQRLVPTVGIQPAQPLWHEWAGKLKQQPGDYFRSRSPSGSRAAARGDGGPCSAASIGFWPLHPRRHGSGCVCRSGTPHPSPAQPTSAQMPGGFDSRWSSAKPGGDGAGRKHQFCTQGASRRKLHRDESAQRGAASEPYDVLMRSAALLATSERRRETVQRGKTHCLLSFARRHVACLCDVNSCKVPP
jgi:hypothetical protein